MRHIKSLDGLRGIAVILVLIAHTPLIIDLDVTSTVLRALKFLGIGYIGVELFFILSGYLITSILLESVKSQDGVMGNFYIKRIFRLLPVIVVSISICLAIFPDFDYLYQLLFLSNYYFSFNLDPHPLRHFWSLAVEEQFYIFWPIIIILFKRNMQALTKAMIILAVASCTFILFYDFIIATEESRALIYRGIESRMLSLLAGCAIAIHGVPTIKSSRILLIALAALTITILAKAAGKFYGFNYVASISAFGYLLFSVCLFILSIHAKGIWNKLLEAKPLTFAGKISYGLYVYHVPVFFYFGVSHMQPGGKEASLGEVATIYMVTVFITLTSWYLLEKPLLKVKDDIIKKRSESGEPAEERCTVKT